GASHDCSFLDIRFPRSCRTVVLLAARKVNIGVRSPCLTRRLVKLGSLTNTKPPLPVVAIIHSSLRHEHCTRM
ncbi:MAG: hypothetical protein KDA75_16440, partial [Planctomycetaceae bacterium]|nr:hypothetical protein [Planctomycetaceae bacterium]